jgi:hypothetical protein
LNDIFPSLSALDKILRSEPRGRHGFDLHCSVDQNGVVRTGKKWSGHQALTIVKHLSTAYADISTWPLIGELGTEFTLNAGWANSKPSFGLYVENYLTTKMGSASARIVSENAMALHGRLTIARAKPEDRSLSVKLWRIESSGRETRNFLARTPREAALKFSAITLRSYKEARKWKSIRDEILHIGQVSPEKDWR